MLMAINLDNYRDQFGNLQSQEKLIKDITTDLNTTTTKTQNLPADGSFKLSDVLRKYQNIGNTSYTVGQTVTTMTSVGIFIIIVWQPNNALQPSFYLFQTAWDSATNSRLALIGGGDTLQSSGGVITSKVSSYLQVTIFRI